MSSTTNVTQYGFFFDQSRCVGCERCTASCKSWNLLPPGPTKWLRVFQWESGTFPSVRVSTLFAPCYHCANPVCVAAAGDGSLFKEPKYGAVLIDPDLATGNPNLRTAAAACPYGAIVFDSDSPSATASKCTMCVDRLEQGLKPVCVLACPVRALDFDTLENIQTKYGTTMDMTGLPSSSIATPAISFKPQVATKTNLVTYDVDTALQLFASRPTWPSGLPPVYSQPTDVTDIPAGLMLKNTLVLQPKTTEELMLRTQDDNS